MYFSQKEIEVFMKTRLLPIVFAFITFSLFAQKKPINTELYDISKANSLNVYYTVSDIKMNHAGPNAFYVLMQNHIEKRSGNNYLGNYLIYRRRKSDLQVIDSLIIQGNLRVEQSESDSYGNLYLGMRFIDSINIPNAPTLYSSARESVLMKLDSNFNVVWAQQSPLEYEGFGISPDGNFVYLIGDHGGFGGNVTFTKLNQSGNLVSSKLITGIGYVDHVKVDLHGNLYVAGGCMNNNAQIDSLNLSHSYNYSLYYGKFDSSMTAIWFKIMDDITCESPQLQIDGQDRLHFLSPLNKSLQLDTFNLVKYMTGRDDFLYSITQPNGQVESVHQMNSVNAGSSVEHIFGKGFSQSEDGMAMVFIQEYQDTVQWSANHQSISQHKDPVIVEYDFQGNITGASSFPTPSREFVKSILYIDSGKVIIAGNPAGYLLYDFNDTLTTTLLQYYVQEWKVPLSVGEEEEHLQSKLKSFDFYPNPVKDVLYFDQTFSGQLFNQMGALVKEINSARSVNIKDLPKGLYYLRDQNGFADRLIKQ